MLNVAVVDDAGFGLSGGKGVFGKEVYSELLAKINEEYLDNKVYRILLGQGYTENPNVNRFVGSSKPVIRVFMDKKLEHNLAIFLEENKVDIVHANILNPRYVLPLINSVKRSRGKLVYTIHSYIPLCPLNWKTYIPEMKPCTYMYPSIKCLKCIHKWRMLFKESAVKTLRGLLQIELIRRLMKEADAIISPSERFAELSRKELSIKTYHIPNPANPSLLNGVRLSRIENKRYALYVGRLEYEKGVHLLPDIAKLIHPIELHVAGQGRLADYIKRSRPSNLIYHGYVDADTKQELYRGAAVIVVPSIWMEMFGYTVVEAFSFTKPVVTFDHAGPGELVKKSQGGLLAKPFDVSKLAQNTRRIIEEELTEKLGLRGREFVEKHLHPSKYAKSLKGIYLKIL